MEILEECRIHTYCQFSSDLLQELSSNTKFYILFSTSLKELDQFFPVFYISKTLSSYYMELIQAKNIIRTIV
jgi:hypothetical protein